MDNPRSRSWRRILPWFLGLGLGCLVALSLLFPGQRLALAVTIATGIGRDSLQARLSAIETKAIRRQALSDTEKRFLVAFYSSLATGAKLTVLVRQTGKLMEHYLGRSGTDYRLESEIFTSNRKVQVQMGLLRERAKALGCKGGRALRSPVFHMPDRSNIDSVFGLYHGRVILTESVDAAGGCSHHWRAEVPWVWPSYDLLRRKYGDPYAERFPLPSIRSLLLGKRHALFVGNGLGHHLEVEGLAKSFLAFGEWSEVAQKIARSDSDSHPGLGRVGA